MSIERDVLVGVGALTLPVYKGIWYGVGYSAIFLAWMCFVGPFQLVYWIYELAVWIVAACKRRPFTWIALFETLYFTPPWGMDRYQHPSRRRQARQRRAARDRHLTEADRQLHLAGVLGRLEQFA